MTQVCVCDYVWIGVCTLCPLHWACRANCMAAQIRAMDSGKKKLTLRRG